MKSTDHALLRVIEARIKTKVAIVLAGLIVSLMAPIGMWLTVASVVQTEKISIAISISFIVSVWGLVGSFLIVRRALYAWIDYVERFADETNAIYNQSELSVRSSMESQITSPFMRLDMVRDVRIIVSLWQTVCLGFTLSFALAGVERVWWSIT